MYRLYYNYEIWEALTQIITADSKKEAKEKFYSQGWVGNAEIILIVNLLE